MSNDKELQVRLQFLEEAQEYLDNMESGLLGLGTGQVNPQQMDGVLRAAHSIKGGAAMMGFQQLSHLAHRLEDFFKVLKIGKVEAVNDRLESLLLGVVDCLRQIVGLNRQQKGINDRWLMEQVNPLFDQLHEILGDPQPEDAAALLSAEIGEDMSTLIFETEVEELLQKLEASLSDSAANIAEELFLAAQELNGLGEMLELSAFGNLCQSVIEHLEVAPEKAEIIAQTALQEWRRSQALVLIGQVDVLPEQINLEDENSFFAEDPVIAADDLDIDEIANSSFINSILDTDNLEQEALDLFSSLENIATSVTEGELSAPKSSPVAVSPSQDDISPEIVTSRMNSQSPQTIELSNSVNNSQDKTIRVSVQQLEKLSDLFGEVIIERNGLNLRLRNLRNLVNLLSQRIKILEQSNFRLRVAYDQVATEVIAVKTNTSNVSQANSDSLISVSTLSQTPTNSSENNYFDSLEMDRYSDIHLLSQEVMETVVQIQEVSKDIELGLEDTEKNTKQLNRTSKQMQTTITQVRMRPVSDLIGHFPRALRDMELQYGKKVNLKVKGGATLLDRSILEALNEPLLHLFRNAFDHGIEDPATRRAIGKPERGLITISASYRGNYTAIAMSDDGKGINLDKIKARAVEIGVSPADLEKAKEEDLLELIFEPGFSTAEQVTDLSGRGVGMDVVRTNIEQIDGKIQVQTKEKIGTTFTIIVPFTLSIVRALLVESNGIFLAIPTNLVEEILVLEPEMVLEVAGQEVLKWEELIVRLIRLNQCLDLPPSHNNFDLEVNQNPTIDQPTVLMIAQGNDLVGLVVDRYWQEEEITTRQVEGNIPLPPGFTGCTILGDGRVVPLVDAIALLSWVDNEQPNTSHFKLSSQRNLSNSETNKQTPSAPNSTSTSQKKTIMVVDDSINVRRFLALTLEKANYRVEQAKDGQDALEKLNAGLKVQGVVCDIEMPRLDGYGFLSRVKSLPQHKHLPIIMLTSRSGDKHRQLAMNLGATAYFGKPFKEQELLATLAELTINQ
jgi:chemosensory pili system protein ChpA (sensor histidine kinase/response regulator)